eukprot:3001628-Rhodomonas_salina.4
MAQHSVSSETFQHHMGHVAPACARGRRKSSQCHSPLPAPDTPSSLSTQHTAPHPTQPHTLLAQHPTQLRRLCLLIIQHSLTPAVLPACSAQHSPHTLVP